MSREFLDPLVFIGYMRTVGDVRDAFERKLEIDRIDNGRGYERGNLRWATRTEQNRNKRNNVRVDYGGERGILFGDFVERYCTIGLSRAAALHREGVPLDEIARKVGRGKRGTYRRSGLRHNRGGSEA